MIWLNASRNLVRNKKRTLMVLFTMALGAGGLFGFHGLNAGMLEQYRKNTIRAKYGHGELFKQGFRERVHEEPWKYWIDDWQKLETVLQKSPDVERVFPRLSFPALIQNGEKTVTALGNGLDGAAEDKFFTLLNIVEGTSTAGNRDGIVLGNGLAHALRVKTGDSVRILANTVHGTMNAADLTVLGIFHMGAKDIDDRMFRIELAQAQTLLDTGAVESVALGLRDDHAFARVANYISQELPGIEAVPFEVLDWVYYGNSVKWLNSQFGFFEAIILLIVLLGIFNTVSVSILDRKEEFGFLRANGESRLQIFSLIVTEAVMLGLAGAFLGLGLTWVLNATVLSGGLEMPPAPGFTRPFSFNLLLELSSGMRVIVLACLTALLGTVLAGVRVLRLGIAESIRAY